MKLTIPRSELKAAVAGFRTIIAGKTTLPVLGYIKFECRGDTVVASATDLDQQAQYTFVNSACEGTGTFTTGFSQLRDLSKGSDGDSLEFTSTGKDTLTVVNPVAGQSMRLDLPTMDPDDWPSQTLDIKTQPADDFLKVFQRLAPFASTDSTRYVLNACFLDVSEKGEGKSKLVATDGQRLCLCNSMTLRLKESAIIPTTKFLSWLKGECLIGAAEKNGTQWFAVETGPWQYLCKTISGTFPNYKQVLPVESGDNRITFAEDIAPLKQILRALPDTDSKGAIIMRASPAGTLMLCATGSDDKEVSIELQGATYTGKCRQYCLNRHFLMDALSAGFRVFTFIDELSPAVSDDGHGGKHIIMPIRFNSAAPAPATEPDSQEQKADAPVTATPVAETEKAIEQTAAIPVAETITTKRETKGAKEMKNENTASAITKLSEAYDAAKDKVKEAHASLADLAVLIKDALREDKLRRAEVDGIRSSLAKIQAIKV